MSEPRSEKGHLFRCRDEGHEFLCRFPSGSCARTGSGSCNEADEDGVAVTIGAYVVSRIPDDTSDHSTWSVRVEAAGHGRWAVRNMGNCLNKQGEWEYEPQPSSRTDEWLATVRWDDHIAAIDAAVEAEPNICWNGLTPADVLAKHAEWAAESGSRDGSDV